MRELKQDATGRPFGTAFAVLRRLKMGVKPGDLNEDGKEIEQDGNITWVEFDNRLLVDVNADVLKLTGKEVEE